MGRPPPALKAFISMDLLFTIYLLISTISSILEISSCWRFISRSPEPPPGWREVLSKARTSGVVTNSTGKGWFCEENRGRDLYLALGIRLLFLIYYLHRSKLSLNLLYALVMDVSISLRVEYCWAWMIHSACDVVIYYLACLFSQDGFESDKMGHSNAARISSTLFCMHSYYESIQ